MVTLELNPDNLDPLRIMFEHITYESKTKNFKKRIF